METVRIPSPEAFPPEVQQLLEGMKAWFRIDVVPKMSLVTRVIPEVGIGLGRATKRAMPDGALSRAQKEMIDSESATPEVRAVFEEIRAFYAAERVPHVFSAMAHDPRFLADLWSAVRGTFEPRRLDRLMKEILALAASLTARSDYGVDLHLREARRLGLSERGLTEVLQVVQLFNGYSKIADALRLVPEEGLGG